LLGPTLAIDNQNESLRARQYYGNEVIITGP
jgi:hypothetical protein